MDKNTIRVLVGSKNPTKTNAVKDAFVEVFPKNNILVFGEAAPSLVSDQPMSNKETLVGAENRVGCLLKKRSDYYVGIEGGCVVKNKKRCWKDISLSATKRDSKVGFKGC